MPSSQKGARHCAFDKCQWVREQEKAAEGPTYDKARCATRFLNAKAITVTVELEPQETREEEPRFSHWLVCPVGKRGRASTRCYTTADVQEMIFRYGDCAIKEVWV